MPKTNTYFVSDFHLGVPTYEKSLEREKLLVSWLNDIKDDAKEIYLMGDVFDFWFEYKTVVPKGYVRLFGKLVELTDAGIPIYLFRGNHDMWAFDYMEKEVGLELHRAPMIKEINNKRFYIAHGDGLGPGDYGYKFLKKIFEFKFNQWLFRWLHPDLSIKIALFWSRRSRYANISKELDKQFNPDTERLYLFAKNKIYNGEPIDYFIFGHRHIPVDLPIGDKARYVNLGDWIIHFSYAIFDGENLRLEYYKK